MTQWKKIFTRENLPDLLFWLLAVILVFLNLGVKGISGSEARWTCVVREMFLSGNFLQPTVNFEPYFDKPLVSYWLIAGLAAFNHGAATELLARIPSALAALAALWATRVIAFRLWTRPVAVTASWIFLTIYSFAFWGRLGEADMLNMAFGTIAVAWYIVCRNRTDIFAYTIFGILCAIGGQTKGLSAIAIPAVVVLTDLIINRTWKRHLNWRILPAGAIAILVYLLPFVMASMKSGDYSANGLYLVFRENIERYFNPFDHKGPWYDYFKYLPQLFIPWTPFLVLAVAWSVKEWKRLSGDDRWLLASNIVIFVVFSLSGSKRIYYILPILPFCAILTALYLCRQEKGFWEWIKNLLLNIYEWVFFAAGILLLFAPLVWFFVSRALAYRLPENVSIFFYAFPLPLGLMFLYIFLQFRRKNIGPEWDFNGYLSFTKAALSSAVLMILVFCVAIPVFDVAMRTEKTFALQSGKWLADAGIKPEHVRFLEKSHINYTYYLSYSSHIPVMMEEEELIRFLNPADKTPRAVIAQVRDFQRLKNPELRASLNAHIFAVEPLMPWEKKKSLRKNFVILSVNAKGPDFGKINIF